MFLTARRETEITYNDVINMTFAEVVGKSDGRLKRRSDRVFYVVMDGEEITTSLLAKRFEVSKRAANNRLKLYAYYGDEGYLRKPRQTNIDHVLSIPVAEIVPTLNEYDLYVRIDLETVKKLVKKSNAEKVFHALDSGLLTFEQFEKQRLQGIL